MKDWPEVYISIYQESILDDYRTNGYWNAIQWPKGIEKARLDYWWLQLRPLPTGHGDETKDSVFIGPFKEDGITWSMDGIRQAFILMGKRVVTPNEMDDCPDCHWEQEYIHTCPIHSPRNEKEKNSVLLTMAILGATNAPHAAYQNVEHGEEAWNKLIAERLILKEGVMFFLSPRGKEAVATLCKNADFKAGKFPN